MVWFWITKCLKLRFKILLYEQWLWHSWEFQHHTTVVRILTTAIFRLTEVKTKKEKEVWNGPFLKQNIPLTWGRATAICYNTIFYSTGFASPLEIVSCAWAASTLSHNSKEKPSWALKKVEPTRSSSSSSKRWWSSLVSTANVQSTRCATLTVGRRTSCH